jgi:hypothetical protein
MEEVNKKIASIQYVIQSVQEGDYIVSVQDTEYGYDITFVSGKKISVSKTGSGPQGRVPQISAGKYIDGLYYWTVDGKWLTDGNGNPIRVTGDPGQPGKDAIPPQFQVDDNGNWEISTDGGKTGTPINPGPGSGSGVPPFERIDYENNPRFVVFYFANGDVVYIPKYVAPDIIAGPIDITSALTPPVNGGTPVPSFANTWISGIVQWMRESSPGQFDVQVMQAESFISDADYEADVTLRPLTGYTFSSGSIDVKHANSVSGSPVPFPIKELTNSGDEILDYIAVGKIRFRAKSSYPLNDLSLTGKIAVPLAGARPQTSFDGTQYTGTIAWTPSASVFQMNTNYTARVTLKAKPGFTFAGIAKDAFSHIYAKQVTNDALPGTDGGQTLAVTLTFDAAPYGEPITAINLRDVIRTPVTGAIPVTSFTRGNYSGIVTWWKNSACNIPMMEGFFQSNTEYWARIELTPAAEHYFGSISGSNVISPDGMTRVSSSFTSQSGTVTLYSTTQMGEDRPVTLLNLTVEIPRPVIGRQPVKSCISSQYSGTVEWHPNVLPEGFAANQFYTATVSLGAADGYTFKDGNKPVGFIHNDGDLKIPDPAANWDGDSLKLTIAYPATAVPLLTTFSGPVSTGGSAIDMIRAAAAAGKNSLSVMIEPTMKDEKVTLTADTDLGTLGLVLNLFNPASPTSPASPATLIIDGAGLVVDLTGGPTGAPLITVGSGITLTLQHITFKGLHTTDGDNNNNTAPVIVVEESGMLIMGSGAVIADNNNAGNGGGIVVEKGGTLTMNIGAEVSGNTGNAGAGVYVRGGTFNLTGGRVNRNTVNGGGDGGGVLVAESTSETGSMPGAFSMDGGEINGNKISGGNGGGVSVTDGATFTINGQGGNISGNTSGNGGGVSVTDGATFSISARSGGNISGNTSGNGGGVYIKDPGSRFEMYYGMIHSNEANGLGGGVYINGAATLFSMQNTATVSANSAKQGGGVYTECPFEMYDGSRIINNTATNGGGGVFVSPQGLFTMNDGRITGNKVEDKDGNGGGVYVATSAGQDGLNGRFLMKGGNISGNAIFPGGTGTDGTGKGAGVYVDVGNISQGIRSWFTKTEGATIHGGYNVNNNEWEHRNLQNYYRTTILEGTVYNGGAGYASLPGGAQAGHAVYYEYTDTTYQGAPCGPFWYNNTLTGPLTTEGDDWRDSWQTGCLPPPTPPETPVTPPETSDPEVPVMPETPVTPDPDSVTPGPDPETE